MKKYFFLFLLIPVLLFIYLIYGKISPKIPEDSKSTEFSEDTQKNFQLEISLNDNRYLINWFIVDDPEKIRFIPNYELNKDSEEIIKSYGCKFLSSAGFYSSDSKPIGLMIFDGILYSKYQKNNILNSIFSIGSDGNVAISDKTYDGQPYLALQTGPKIISKYNPENLISFNQKSGRRMVVGITEEKKLLFLTIYESEYLFEGPRIGEIPAILDEFIKLSKLKIYDATNLDGGSASVFKNSETYLKEISKVGSFFCIN